MATPFSSAVSAPSSALASVPPSDAVSGCAFFCSASRSRRDGDVAMSRPFSSPVPAPPSALASDPSSDAILGCAFFCFASAALADGMAARLRTHVFSLEREVAVDRSTPFSSSVAAPSSALAFAPSSNAALGCAFLWSAFAALAAWMLPSWPSLAHTLSLTSSLPACSAWPPSHIPAFCTRMCRGPSSSYTGDLLCCPSGVQACQGPGTASFKGLYATGELLQQPSVQHSRK